MYKISIIGANSYIARNLICVIAKNHSNIIMNLYDFQDKHLDSIENYFKINICDVNSISNTVDFNCDALFMFVGKTGTSNFDDFDTCININEKSLLNLLSVYKEKKSTAKIIFPSTRLVYKGSDLPLKEDDVKECKSLYAISKYACEQYLQIYSKLYNIRYIILRICVPYGTLISNAHSYGTYEFFLSKAKNGENISLYGDGGLRRTFTHISDLCNILLLTAFDNKCVNDTYNVGGENLSLKEIAIIISKKYQVNIDYKSWPREALILESGNTVFNSNKLDTLIKYQYVNKLKD